MGWKVQELPPRDYYDEGTLTIPEWLDKVMDGNAFREGDPWLEFIYAAAMVAPLIKQYSPEGLRGEPRVGYDLVSDQIYFLFKLDNNGTTFIVSRDGVPEAT